MTDVDEQLEELRRRNERIADLAAEQMAEVAERDELVRTLLAADVSWKTLNDTGMSNATIAKARRQAETQKEPRARP